VGKAIIRRVADKKVANSVLALSSAAVIAVYGAGYAKTRDAADRFAQQRAERRTRMPPATETSPRSTAQPTGNPEPLIRTAAGPAPEGPAASAATATPSTLSSTPARPVETTPEGAARTAPPRAAAGQDATHPAAAAATTSPLPDAASAASAPQTTPALPAPAAPAPSPEAVPSGYKDGTYYGWGTSRHGDIQAAVVIEEGRITVARVEQCLTRYSCSWITPIPPRILSRQSTTYDYVSGVTESSDAFQDAVAEALSQAK
jgi:uncharacterized protein with FMN-binding domain